MSHVYIKERLIMSGCLIVNDKKEVLLLFRSDHKHYETPGGKVRLNECKNPENPSVEDLGKTAERELFEELGNNISIEEFEYFGKAELTIPDGRLGVAHKFLVKIKGNPKLNEPDKFSRFDYLPIDRLEDYPISPDLKVLTPEIKKRLL